MIPHTAISRIISAVCCWSFPTLRILPNEEQTALCHEGICDSLHRVFASQRAAGFYDNLFSIAQNNAERRTQIFGFRISDVCLTRKSELFRLRFVLFAAVRSASFPLFPSSPACSNPILGQKWVRNRGLQFFWHGAPNFSCVMEWLMLL